MLRYSFDGEVAECYGVKEAILYEVLCELTCRFGEFGENPFNRRFGVRCSIKDLSQVFPYWSEKQIARILYSLIDQGAVIEAEHNRSKHDKKKWYSVNEEKLHGK